MYVDPRSQYCKDYVYMQEGRWNLPRRVHIIFSIYDDFFMIYYDQYL